MLGRRECSAIVALVAWSCTGCGSDRHPSAPPGGVVAKISVTSNAFSPNGAIPVDHTCDGADRSPQLSWSAPPPGTRSMVVLVDDQDSLAGDFTHWIAFNIPPSTAAMPEGIDVATVGGEEGTNSFGRVGYAGPCPPRRELHRYAFRVLALDVALVVPSGATLDSLNQAMSHHLIAEGILVGTFSH